MRYLYKFEKNDYLLGHYRENKYLFNLYLILNTVITTPVSRGNQHVSPVQLAPVSPTEAKKFFFVDD